MWQRLTVSRAREQRSQLTAAKFRVLTGSLKSLLDQGLVDALLFALTTQSRVHTVPIFSVKAVQMAAVEQDWIVPRKGITRQQGIMLARTIRGETDPTLSGKN